MLLIPFIPWVDVLLQDANALRAEECYLREWDDRLVVASARLMPLLSCSRIPSKASTKLRNSGPAGVDGRIGCGVASRGQFVSMASAMVMYGVG
jgi:hypothetical protein